MSSLPHEDPPNVNSSQVASPRNETIGLWITSSPEQPMLCLSSGVNRPPHLEYPKTQHTPKSVTHVSDREPNAPEPHHLTPSTPSTPSLFFSPTTPALGDAPLMHNDLPRLPMSVSILSPFQIPTGRRHPPTSSHPYILQTALGRRQHLDFRPYCHRRAGLAGCRLYNRSTCAATFQQQQHRLLQRRGDASSSRLGHFQPMIPSPPNSESTAAAAATVTSLFQYGSPHDYIRRRRQQQQHLESYPHNSSPSKCSATTQKSPAAYPNYEARRGNNVIPFLLPLHASRNVIIQQQVPWQLVLQKEETHSDPASSSSTPTSSPQRVHRVPHFEPLYLPTYTPRTPMNCTTSRYEPRRLKVQEIPTTTKQIDSHA